MPDEDRSSPPTPPTPPRCALCDDDAEPLRRVKVAAAAGGAARVIAVCFACALDLRRGGGAQDAESDD